MSQDGNRGNREEFPLGKIVLSNMYSMEDLIDVLVEKGLVTKEEVLKRIEKVVRIYRRGNQEKRAHLIGFLNGADPGEG